ncbi:MAG: hypothetical protein H0T45_12190 [Pyrinomonadaceae bacterium]|nr:hypothetical protein [Pyrinomonadaceae bacterium]
MRPLSSENQESNTLAELGRASVQIVHDLKNQLNGLKLYATFLRKRFETQERPADERETIAKLIAGLERAAADMTILVRYGRPLETRTQPKVDLAQLLAPAAAAENQTFTPPESKAMTGDFDAEKLAEAFKHISAGAARARASDTAEQLVSLRRQAETDGETIVIEWHGVKHVAEGNLFNSFAGSDALRLALAANIVRAHGGAVAHDADTLRVRLPLQRDEG